MFLKQFHLGCSRWFVWFWIIILRKAAEFHSILFTFYNFFKLKNWNCWATAWTEFCGCSLIHIWRAEWISIEWMEPLDENVNCFLWLDVLLCIVLRKAFLFITSCYHLLSSTCIWGNLPFLSHRSEEFQSSNYFDELKLLLLRSGLRCFPAESQTHFSAPLE